MRVYGLLAGLIIGLMTGCSVVEPLDTRVSYQWFEYRGDDSVFREPVPAGWYQNPILAGFYPDPSIVRAGDTFYMVNSSFSYFPGVPLWRSTDLVNWESLGYVLDRPQQLPLADASGVSRGIYAPTIRYHDGIFYVITTGVDGAGGNFIVTTRDPAGDWSDPVPLPEIGGIDPSMFFDDDGRVYITHNGDPDEAPRYNGHRAIWLWEFDLANMAVVPGSGRVIVNGGVDISREPIWIEGPHIYKVDGWYYLLCAEGGTADQHSEVVFRTRDLQLPFVPYQGNPILTQRDLPASRENPVATAGHADLVQTPEGEWWAVFLATRNYHQDFFNTGRETFLLPVSWESGWPVILEPGESVPYRLPAPKGLPTTSAAVASTGNFQWRDDFDQSQLVREWNALRSFPDYNLTDGQLRLQPTAAIGATPVPAFLGRRQQHLRYSAETSLTLPGENIQAGMVAFQSELAYYFIYVEKLDSRLSITVEMNSSEEKQELIRLPVSTDSDTLMLSIDADGDKLAFYYRIPGHQRQLLVDGIDARVLSTQRAGGFVGAYVGMHARLHDGAVNTQ